MARSTDTKWSCLTCSRCGESHQGYRGKLDRFNVEYVVCGNTHKRMDVQGEGLAANSWAFPTVWSADPAPVPAKSEAGVSKRSK